MREHGLIGIPIPIGTLGSSTNKSWAIRNLSSTTGANQWSTGDRQLIEMEQLGVLCTSSGSLGRLQFALRLNHAHLHQRCIFMIEAEGTSLVRWFDIRCMGGLNECVASKCQIFCQTKDHIDGSIHTGNYPYVLKHACICRSTRGSCAVKSGELLLGMERCGGGADRGSTSLDYGGAEHESQRAFFHPRQVQWSKWFYRRNSSAFKKIVEKRKWATPTTWWASAFHVHTRVKTRHARCCWF